MTSLYGANTNFHNRRNWLLGAERSDRLLHSPKIQKPPLFTIASGKIFGGGATDRGPKTGNSLTVQQPFLIDGTDCAPIPDIAEMPFLSAICQQASPEHGGTFAAGIADAFVDNPVRP